MFEAKVSAAHVVISQMKEEALESLDKLENNRTDVPWALSFPYASS